MPNIVQRYKLLVSALECSRHCKMIAVMEVWMVTRTSEFIDRYVHRR